MFVGGNLKDYWQMYPEHRPDDMIVVAKSSASSFMLLKCWDKDGQQTTIVLHPDEARRIAEALQKTATQVKVDAELAKKKEA